MSTIHRDWLSEAYKISSGDKSVRLKREHVCAAVEALMEMTKRAEKMSAMMGSVYQQAKKNREAAGLKMPKPPSLLREIMRGKK